MKLWMLNCQRISEKVSASLDGNLPWHHRLMMRFHTMVCPCCASCRSQLAAMRQAAKYDQAPAQDEPGLSERARERICKALRDDL